MTVANTNPIVAVLLCLGLCSCTGESGGEASPPRPQTAPAAGSTAGGSTLEAIQGRGTLVVACEAAYYPFETMDPDSGEIVGFDIDMMREVAARLGVEVRFDNTEWDGILAALITGKCDVICSGMSITDKRKEKVDFAGPYDQVGQVAMILASRKDEIRTLADLNRADASIAVQVGTTGQAAALEHMPDAEILTFTTAGEAGNDVLIGKADAMVFDDPFVREFMSKNPGKLILVGEPFTTEPIGIAVRKGQTALLEKLNAILAELEGDGTMARLRERWRN